MLFLKKHRNVCKEPPLKAVFLTSEFVKWQYQSLYEAFQNSEFFQPKILVYRLKNSTQHERLYDTFNFFKKNNLDVDFADNFENLKNYADIIFYEQPWGIPWRYKPKRLSKKSICCFVNYGASLTNGSNEFCFKFLKWIQYYFIDNEFSKNLLQSKMGKNKDKIILSGCLKNDAYLNKAYLDTLKNIWPSKDLSRKKVIYAPHFSFDERSVLRFGTFKWNYKFFLEFAKKNENIDFILKPHPLLREEIVKRNLMTKENCENYFKIWNTLKNAKVYEEGNYIDIFKSSDLLITDCCSFLQEYLPTLKPVIHLINKNSVGLNPYGEKITAAYYKTHSLKELEQNIDFLLYKNQDPLKSLRTSLKKQLFMPNGTNTVADFIMNFLRKQVL